MSPARAALQAILPYVQIDRCAVYPVEIWSCNAPTPCRPAISSEPFGLGDAEIEAAIAVADRVREHGFPHTPECPARRALEAARAAAKES